MNKKLLIDIITNECKMTIFKGENIGGNISTQKIPHESDMRYETVKK